MASDLDKARSKVTGDPYRAWQLAIKAIDTAPLDAQKIIVAALELIVSDLDEHGDENLDLYGRRKHSEDEFRALLAQARATLRTLERLVAVSTLAPLPPNPALKLGRSTVIAGPGPWPVAVAGELFTSREGEALVMRAVNGSIVRTLDEEGDPKCLAASPDGRTLAVGTWGGKVSVHDVASGALRWRTELQSDWVTSLAFAPDGARVVSGGAGRLMIQDVTNGAAIVSAELGETGEVVPTREQMFPIRCIAFSANAIITLYLKRLAERSTNDFTVRSSIGADLGDLDLIFVDGRVVVLPNNAIAVWDPAVGVELASSPLVTHKTKSARGLRLASRGNVVGFLLKDKNVMTLELWGLAPLARLATHVLAKFSASDTIAEGGVAFVGNTVVVVGERETLAFPLE